MRTVKSPADLGKAIAEQLEKKGGTRKQARAAAAEAGAQGRSKARPVRRSKRNARAKRRRQRIGAQEIEGQPRKK